MEKFSLKTKSGCFRTLSVCIIVILLSGFIAHLMSTDMGRVKVTRLTLDVRGASVDADLYYPAGTSSADKLPAVVIAHGGGVGKGVTQGLAEEYARRGYVVLNSSAFGAGISEQPVIDDFGLDPESFSVASTTGVLDAVNYLRTLEFVDQTRIGIVGHSLGALRAMLAGVADCGYYTFNDIMINVLSDTFEQKFTEEEIKMDASQLAKERLNADQMEYYNSLETEYRERYDTRIKTICLLGTDGGIVNSMQPVSVAGYEVLRGPQVNFGIILGKWDHNVPAFDGRDKSQEYWHDTEEVENEMWYMVDTDNQTGETAGLIFDTSITENAALKEAIDNREARVFNFIRETHSKNFYSAQAAKYAVRYIEQTLGFNGGDFGETGSKPVSADRIIYLWREVFNLAAMLAMIVMLVPVVGLLIQTKFFASCVPEKCEVSIGSDRKKYWIFSGITVVITFFAMYVTNNLEPPELPAFRTLPLFASWWLTVLFLAILAVCSIALLAVYCFTDKKKYGKNRLSALNVKMKPVHIVKIVIIAIITIGTAYLSLALLEYLFNEDYRWWMAVFSEMRTEYWRWLWRYALLMLPSFLVIGAATNYSVRTDVPQWRDTAVTVVVNSLGVWLLCLVNYLSLLSSGVMVSSFISAYGFLLIVPITVYITRKMYCLTNSIWFGALVNSFLVSWSLISSCGLHCNVYYGQNWITNFFGM